MSYEVWGDNDDDCLSSEEASARADEAFVAGLQAMREMLARFVEQGGDTAIAQSIRLNWRADWGEDPGQPETIATTWAG
jgi:hypothetical protein